MKETAGGKAENFWSTGRAAEAGNCWGTDSTFLTTGRQYGAVVFIVVCSGLTFSVQCGEVWCSGVQRGAVCCSVVKCGVVWCRGVPYELRGSNFSDRVFNCVELVVWIYSVYYTLYTTLHCVLYTVYYTLMYGLAVLSVHCRDYAMLHNIVHKKCRVVTVS